VNHRHPGTGAGPNADNFTSTYRDAPVSLVSCCLSVIGSLAVRLCSGLRHASPNGAADRTLGLAVLAATLALGATNSVILTWGWLHAMVAWPLVAAAATRPVYPALVPQVGPVLTDGPAALPVRL
jgi:hypothetical protein